MDSGASVENLLVFGPSPGQTKVTVYSPAGAPSCGPVARAKATSSLVPFCAGDHAGSEAARARRRLRIVRRPDSEVEKIPTPDAGAVMRPVVRSWDLLRFLVVAWSGSPL